MCGIVGYIGANRSVPVLINGLSRLEYRGYDSAGVAVINGKKLDVIKSKGRLKVLEEKLNGMDIKATVGIGHTRWATHGAPSDLNSHPHTNSDQSIAVVHNGIIENYLKIKDFLIKHGYNFVSETDTEVIAHLVDYYYEGDLIGAVRKALCKLEGAYAIGVVSKDHPDLIVAARKDSPLIVGLGEDENYIASDVPAILKYTRSVYYLDDKEIAVLTRNSVEVYDMDGEVVPKEAHEIEWDVEAAEKGGYEHFMLKEICEQGAVVKATLGGRIKEGSDEVTLDDIKLSKEDLEGISRIFIVACGTAYYAGCVGKYLIEKLARIPVEVDIASEFRYRNPILDEKSLLIVVSQSGETADTLAAVREAKAKGARVLGIINVVGSSIAREADDVLYTWAGPEIAVASTKAYSTQLSAMYILALDFALKQGTITTEEFKKYREELLLLPEKIDMLTGDTENIKRFAYKNYNEKDVFFIGRGMDNTVALEGALKLKEISYIHAEAYGAGELKHGPIALIDKGTLVVALATQEALFDKMLSNIKEVKARGAVVLAIAQEGNTAIENEADDVIYIPKTISEVSSILTVIPLQIFAYYVALARGCDVDKPRNLAKSVTVE